MQAYITEHGMLLKEKGGKKVATTLIKDCIEEVTSAIESTKTAWKTEMEQNLSAMGATKLANKAVETRIKSEYKKLFKTLLSVKSDFARHKQAKHGRSSDVTEGKYVQKITNMLALTTNHFEFQKIYCTRTKEELGCVKTHLGELISNERLNQKENQHRRTH